MGYHPGQPAGVGMLLGYGRVSSTDQDLTIQREKLIAAGVDERNLYLDKASGTTREGRVALGYLLQRIGPGDIVCIVRLDRLGRSLRDLIDILEEIGRMGAHLRVLEQGGIDTTTPAGMMFFQMLGAFAEFETRIRSERQKEGIARARLAKRYTGGKPRVDRDLVRRLKAEGLGPHEIARQANCTPVSVWRILNEEAKHEQA